ncbi:MAG: DUF58 domain-containing protein [Chloroflexi bacterium]|nr:DUF58 domain-containing protein [Chloroflexota bacterium]
MVLVLTLVVLTFGLVSGFPPLLRLFYILTLALAGGSLWAWLNLRHLSVQIERRTPRVHVGQDIEERITVHNNSFLPKPWLEVTDLTDIPGHHAGQVVSLPGRGFRSWRTRTQARRRGVYSLGPLRVASGDPYGVFRLERFFHDPEQVIVLPSVVPLHRFLAPSSELPGDGQLRLRSHQLSPHVASVREYAPGDSLNRIHWPSTVRMQQLMVKEFDLGLSSDVWVVLDMEATAHAYEEVESTEETAVTAAASIASYFLGQGIPLGFTATTRDMPILPPERTSLQQGRILDLLAVAKADGTLSLAQALPKLDAWLTRQTTLVIVTPSSQESWVQVLGGVGQRGIRTASVLVDAASFGGAGRTLSLVPALLGLGSTPYVLEKGANIADALDRPVLAQWDPSGAGGAIGARR